MSDRGPEGIAINCAQYTLPTWAPDKFVDLLDRRPNWLVFLLQITANSLPTNSMIVTLIDMPSPHRASRTSERVNRKWVGRQLWLP
jgi:hypothetical protein